MHGDLCKHLGIDSSTDHPPNRRIYLPVNNCNMVMMVLDKIVAVRMTLTPRVRLRVKASICDGVPSTNWGKFSGFHKLHISRN